MSQGTRIMGKVRIRGMEVENLPILCFTNIGIEVYRTSVVKRISGDW